MDQSQNSRRSLTDFHRGLFCGNIFINDLDARVGSFPMKAAAEMQLEGCANTLGHRSRIQKDFNELENWATDINTGK